MPQPRFPVRIVLGGGQSRWLYFLFGTFVGVLACFSDDLGPDPRGPGTIRMAGRLQKLASQANPVNNIFLNSERVKLLQAEVARTTEPSQLQSLKFSLACELLDSGQNTEALQEFEAVEQALKASKPQELQRNWSKLKHKEALCWLRIGEMTNCLADHNPESCLAPIQGRGVHRFQDGSRHAI